MYRACIKRQKVTLSSFGQMCFYQKIFFHLKFIPMMKKLSWCKVQSIFASIHCTRTLYIYWREFPVYILAILKSTVTTCVNLKLPTRSSVKWPRSVCFSKKRQPVSKSNISVVISKQTKLVQHHTRISFPCLTSHLHIEYTCATKLQ